MLLCFITLQSWKLIWISLAVYYVPLSLLAMWYYTVDMQGIIVNVNVLKHSIGSRDDILWLTDLLCTCGVNPILGFDMWAALELGLLSVIGDINGLLGWFIIWLQHSLKQCIANITYDLGQALGMCGTPIGIPQKSLRCLLANSIGNPRDSQRLPLRPSWDYWEKY